MIKKFLSFLLLTGVLSADAGPMRDPDLPLAAPLPFQSSPKRGIGHWSAPDPAKPKPQDKTLLTSETLDELKLAWYYNWTYTQAPQEEALKDRFVPMQWGWIFPGDVEAYAKLQRQGFKTLLVFNEPDLKSQSNVSHGEIVRQWTKVQGLGFRLGSPAFANDDHLDGFMADAKSLNLRVDFLCLHEYPELGEPDSAETIRQACRLFWNRYHKPIWLTEYSGPAFSWFKHQSTLQENARFARDTSLILDSLPYVERYAWFSSGPGAKEGQGNNGYDPTNLYVKRGELSPVGEAYRDAYLRPDLGLKVSVWKGTFTRFPEKPGRTAFQGKVIGFDPFPDGKDFDAALVYEGYLQVRKRGTYTFALSDPAMSLQIGDTEVVATQGKPEKPVQGSIGLAEGRHRFRLTGLRTGADQRFRVAMSGAGMEPQGIPLDSLFLPTK